MPIEPSIQQASGSSNFPMKRGMINDREKNGSSINENREEHVHIMKSLVNVLEFHDFLNSFSTLEETLAFYKQEMSSFLLSEASSLQEKPRYRIVPGMEEHPITFLDLRAMNAYCAWKNKEEPSLRRKYHLVTQQEIEAVFSAPNHVATFFETSFQEIIARDQGGVLSYGIFTLHHDGEYSIQSMDPTIFTGGETVGFRLAFSDDADLKEVDIPSSRSNHESSSGMPNLEDSKKMIAVAIPAYLIAPPTLVALSDYSLGVGLESSILGGCALAGVTLFSMGVLGLIVAGVLLLK